MHVLLRMATVVIVAASVNSATAQTAAPRWAAAIDSMMARQLATTKTPGAQIAVVEHGRLVFTKGYGVADVETGRPVTDRTLFQVGSVTKLVTGVLLAQLAADGAVDLHAPISRYVTDLAGRRVGAVTAHQLLTQAAGWVAGSNHFGGMDDAALGAVFRAVGDTMMLTEPGRIASYSNPGFSMAGYVAERAAGHRYADLVDSIVLRKLGMSRASFRPTMVMTYDFSQSHIGPPDGAARVQRPMPANASDWPAGFLYASAAELSRLAMALMNQGMLDGTRVLAADAVRAVTTGHVPIPGEPFATLGYGLDVDSIEGRRVWRKNGAVTGFSALLTMWPREELAIAVLVNARTELPDSATALAAQIVGNITPARAVLYRGERDATPVERAQLAGTYTTKQATIVVTDSSGALWLRTANGRALPARLTASGSHLVAGAAGGAGALPFVIVRDRDGQVRFLHRNERAYAKQP